MISIFLGIVFIAVIWIFAFWSIKLNIFEKKGEIFRLNNKPGGLNSVRHERFKAAGTNCPGCSYQNKE